MGSYVISGTRAVAALGESTWGESGLVWARHVAPADWHIVATGKDDQVYTEAERIATELDRVGVDVIYDDRARVSPGVKFADAELVGVPTIVVVGRGLADGVVEVRDRRSGEQQNVAVDQVVPQLRALVGGG